MVKKARTYFSSPGSQRSKVTKRGVTITFTKVQRHVLLTPYGGSLELFWDSRRGVNYN